MLFLISFHMIDKHDIIKHIIKKGETLMSIQMIAVDMDGTFLNAQSTYDVQRFLKIYEELKRQNIRFVIASGNPYIQLRKKFSPIQDELTYIAENGGYIVEKQKELYFAHLSQQESQKIITALYTMPDVLCWACTKEQSYTLESLPEHYYQMFLPYFPGVIKIKDFSQIQEPIIKFALYLPQQNVEKRIADFIKLTQHSVQVIDSGHDCVDIIPQHVDKGHAIEFLMQKYHLNQDEVMAFGDAGNDVAMLKKVTYGYVMANAKEDIKKQFHYIAPSHEDSGVLQVIEQYLQNKTFYHF